MAKTQQVSNENWYPCFRDHGIDEGYLDKWMSNYTITNDNQRKVFNQVLDCVNTSRPIVMLGNYGGGKTHMATALVKNALMNRREGYYYTLTSLFREYRVSLRDEDFNEKKFFKRMFGCDVLVIDECNIRSDSEAENRMIQEIIDRRYMGLKQTVLIANMDLNEFQELMTERLIDRLKEQKAAICTFNWKSHRT